MGHDAELVQAMLQIEHLAWHISTALIACLHPRMKICSSHHLREREEQFKLHQYLDMQRLVVLDQEVLHHLNDGALLVPPCLYNPIIVMMVIEFHNLRLIGSGQQLGGTRQWPTARSHCVAVSHPSNQELVIQEFHVVDEAQHPRRLHRCGGSPIFICHKDMNPCNLRPWSGCYKAKQLEQPV